MKIALLSNVTIEVLAGMLREGNSVWTPAGFGAWMETALNPPEELRSFAPDVVCILLDRHFAGARNWSAGDVTAAASSLKAFLPETKVLVPDVAAIASDLGDAFYDERMWRLAQMPFSLAGMRELAKCFRFNKLLALDLDETLWDGVIGEVGVEGIRPKTEFQRRIKELRKRGVLLAVVSKNNPEDVEPVWQRADMVLTRDDFMAFRINWGEKPDSVVSIANELNLGIDSIVFVDDSPANRAAMRTRLPEVCTTEFPPDLELRFPARTMTAEDAVRTAQYQAESRRREFGAAMDIDEYLNGLCIHNDIHSVTKGEIRRVAQLSQKTNQFNVCTNRRSEEEVRELAADGDHVLLTLASRDRFGDLGLVAYVLARFAGAEATVLDWVMSCRAMNRRIEFALEAELERILWERGVRSLHARWRRTGKNEPVRELFDRFGFELVSATDSERGYLKNIQGKGEKQ